MPRLNPLKFFCGPAHDLFRLGWLRSSPVFLAIALSSPKTKWIVFHDGRPLIHVSKGPNSRRSVNSLALLPTQQILPLLGPEPYFNQGQHPGDVSPAELQTIEHNRVLEAARLHGPGIVFLGTHEPREDAILPSSVFKNPQSADDIKGEPFFAVDVTDVDMKQLEVTFRLTQPGEAGDPRIEFGDARNAGLSFKPLDAALFSEARTMIDWNSRNKVGRILRAVESNSLSPSTHTIDSSALRAAPGYIHYGGDGSYRVRQCYHGQITLVVLHALPQEVFTTLCTLARTLLLLWRSWTKLERRYC